MPERDPVFALLDALQAQITDLRQTVRWLMVAVAASLFISLCLAVALVEMASR